MSTDRITDETEYDDVTMDKVYGALMASGLDRERAVGAVSRMQNAGILFRERRVALGEDGAR